MNKSQKRVRPTFVLSSLFGFFLVGGLLISTGIPSEKDKIKAQIITEMIQSRAIATVLSEQAVSLGGITNVSKQFLLNSLSFAQTNGSAETPRPSHQQKAVKSGYKTNASGEVIDRWQTPYRISLINQTNFLVASAGHNQQFDDEDDLVFDSLSRTFLETPLR